MRKALITFVMIALMLTVATAQQMTRPTELPTLVYGTVELADGTTADGVTYTITSEDATGNTLSTITGTVGTMKSGMIFESQNLAINEGDKLIIEAGTVNETGRMEHLLTSLESFKSYYDFGIMRLSSNVTVTPVPVVKPADIYVNSVRFISDEYLEVGEELITRAILDNIGEKDLEGISVDILVPDLGLHKTVGPFDIDADGRTTERLYVEIPKDAKPGEYGARIEISNEKLHRVVWRTFVVKEQ